MKDTSVLPFSGKPVEEIFDTIDLDSLTRDALVSLLKALSDRFDLLQNEEPDDPESPECLKWLNKISDIEDMMDEVSELIE